MKKITLILFMLLAITPAITLAHKASDSYLSLTIDAGGNIYGRWDIGLRDLDIILPIDANEDRRITWGEIRQADIAINDLMQNALRLRTGPTACLLASDRPAMAIDQHADGRYLVITLQGKCSGSGELHIDYRLLNGVDAAHRGIARISINDTEHALLLTPGQEARIADDTRFTHWIGHAKEGMHHIATGYDHLLFLLSLLLPVALVRSGTVNTRSAWRGTLVLVTAFTIAHSLTLGLATFDLVRLPGRLVESAIAASVLIAALHNLCTHRPHTRWIMALVFGLVHGLGFAAMLGELPTATSERLLALAGFNLGVEAGQLLAVVIFLPLTIALARRHQLGYRRWGVQGGSLAIAAIALLWLCQRLFEWQLIPG